MQEEDKIKDLFAAFDPITDNSDQFMDRLEMRLDAADNLKRYISATRRHYILTSIAAAVAGFITGCLCTTLLPYLFTYLTPLFCLIPSPDEAYEWQQITLYLLTALLTVWVIFSTYRTMKRLFST